MSLCNTIVVIRLPTFEIAYCETQTVVDEFRNLARLLDKTSADEMTDSGIATLAWALDNAALVVEQLEATISGN